MTEIGAYAFNDCLKLESIVVPDSVTRIGLYAFNDCFRLDFSKLEKQYNVALSKTVEISSYDPYDDDDCKYWKNGNSDDVMDAFEGDSDALWNVD